MDAKVFVEHREKLVAQLPDNSMTFLFAGSPKQKSNDNDYPFRVNNNFYYLTGMDKAGQAVVITKLNGNVRPWLFIERPDPKRELFEGKMLDKESAAQLSGIENVEFIDKMESLVGRMLGYYSYETILFDFHKRAFDYEVLQENDLANRLRTAYPYLQVKNIAPIVNNLRRIKSPEEVECIKTGIAMTEKGIKAIVDHLRAGVNEAELQAHWDFALTMNGVKDNAFLPIIAGGKNSCVLHYEANCEEVPAGGVLQLDLGAEWNYYASDISRCFPVDGKFTEEQKIYYNAVLAGQQAVLEYLAPGKEMRGVEKAAREAIGNALIAAGKIESLDEMRKLLPHGVSHYVGLDVHDVGDVGLLEPGMVITVEPGVYIPELELGIRIEDDALITEDGAVFLTPSIMKTVEEIEEYMANRK